MSDLITLKTHRNGNYSTISLTALHDRRLSLKAKGLHTYLISRPPGWKIQKADLLNRTRTGRDALNTAISELKNNGYLKMHRSKDIKGKFEGWDWEVYEEPQTLETSEIKPKYGKSVLRKNCKTGNPHHSIDNGTTNHYLSSSPSPPQAGEEEERDISQLPPQFAALDQRTLARLERACRAQSLDLTEQAKALCLEYSQTGVEMRRPAGALMAKIKEGGIHRPEELVEVAKEAEVKREKERKRIEIAQKRGEIPRFMR